MLAYAAVLTTGLVLQAAAHGIIQKVTVTGGKTYNGYVPYGSTADKVGWITPGNKDWGFVLPTAYNSADIICHKGATPATAAVEVAAGGELTLQWDQWAESHHGPVIDYLAPAGTDDISKIDKNQLQFVKIAEGGQTGGKTSNPPALLFASDDLRKAGLSWKVKIPATVKAGTYVLRHEIIALHEGEKLNKAQNYPQCITLKVTGGGNVAPTGGVPATSFYKAADPGINYNLYWDVKLPYPIPGPSLWSGAGSAATPASPASGKPASSPVASPVVKVPTTVTPDDGNTSSGSGGSSNPGSEVDSSKQGSGASSGPTPDPVGEPPVDPSSASPTPTTGTQGGRCKKHRKGKGHKGSSNQRRHARDLTVR